MAASVLPQSMDLMLMTINTEDLVQSSGPHGLGHHADLRAGKIEETLTLTFDDGTWKMETNHSETDSQSPDESHMAEAERKRERRKKQKRDYATRKRMKDKTNFEALEQKRKLLQKGRGQLLEDITKLKALRAYLTSYEALLKASCKYSGQKTAQQASPMAPRTSATSSFPSRAPSSALSASCPSPSDLEQLPDLGRIYDLETDLMHIGAGMKDLADEDHVASGDLFSFDMRAPIPFTAEATDGDSKSPVKDLKFWIS